MRDGPVVDAWIQHPTPEFLHEPMFESLLRWMELENVPDEIPLSITLDTLESSGVNKAMICAWHGPQGSLLPNDFVAELVDQGDGRLEGIASVDISQPMQATESLRKCVNDYGFRGLRILPWLWELPPNDRRYYPLYAECVKLNVPFCLQVGHTGPLKPSEYGRPIPYLDDVAREFPDLTIVGGHIGHPWTTEMIALARKYQNVYIDTSAYKPSRYPVEFVKYMKESNCKKVLFGSNYPMIQPEECLSELNTLNLSEDTLDRFLYKNAASVFDLDLSKSQ